MNAARLRSSLQVHLKLGEAISLGAGRGGGRFPARAFTTEFFSSAFRRREKSVRNSMSIQQNTRQSHKIIAVARTSAWIEIQLVKQHAHNTASCALNSLFEKLCAQCSSKPKCSGELRKLNLECIRLMHKPIPLWSLLCCAFGPFVNCVIFCCCCYGIWVATKDEWIVEARGKVRVWLTFLILLHPDCLAGALWRISPECFLPLVDWRTNRKILPVSLKHRQVLFPLWNSVSILYQVSLFRYEIFP